MHEFYDGVNKKPALKVKVYLDKTWLFGESGEGGGGAGGDDEARAAELCSALFELAQDLWHLVEPHLFNMAYPDYMAWNVPELGLIELQMQRLGCDLHRVELIDYEDGLRYMQMYIAREPSDSR